MTTPIISVRDPRVHGMADAVKQDVVTLHGLAASIARIEEILKQREDEKAADKKERQEERAVDKKERQEERVADKQENEDKMAALIVRIEGILNKAETEKNKAKKEREDADARMWQGLKEGFYAMFLSQFTWTHKGGGFCTDTHVKAE